ncbi:MAG: hypothetical protein LCH61_20035, partial [Proteobacteria bacterium]|nr:hypothetical protein [Pseudomonadota bacterium]
VVANPCAIVFAFQSGKRNPAAKMTVVPKGLLTAIRGSGILKLRNWRRASGGNVGGLFLLLSLLLLIRFRGLRV